MTTNLDMRKVKFTFLLNINTSWDSLFSYQSSNIA